MCQQRVRRGLPPAPQIVVDVCLSAFRLLRQGKRSDASELITDVASPASCMEEDGVDAKRLGERVQSVLNDAVAAELVELERSAMPEGQKTSKRKRINVRLYPNRLRRKRASLDALFLAHGEAVGDAESIGATIAQHWALIFANKEVEESDA